MTVQHAVRPKPLPPVHTILTPLLEAWEVAYESRLRTPAEEGIDNAPVEPADMTEPDVAALPSPIRSHVRRVSAGVLYVPRLFGRWIIVLGAVLVWLIGVPLVDAVRSLLRRRDTSERP